VVHPPVLKKKQPFVRRRRSPLRSPLRRPEDLSVVGPGGREGRKARIRRSRKTADILERTEEDSSGMQAWGSSPFRLLRQAEGFSGGRGR
jgi:hypothetical protein